MTTVKQGRFEISAKGDHGWYKCPHPAVLIGGFAVFRTPMFYQEWRVANANTGFAVKNFYTRQHAIEAARRLSSTEGFERLDGMSMQRVARLAKHKPAWFRTLERRSKKAMRSLIEAEEWL